MKRLIALITVLVLYAVFVVSFTYANNKGLIEEGFNSLGINLESNNRFEGQDANPIPHHSLPDQLDLWDPMPPPPDPPPPPGP